MKRQPNGLDMLLPVARLLIYSKPGADLGGGASDARLPFFDQSSCDFLFSYKTPALNVSTTK